MKVRHKMEAQNLYATQLMEVELFVEELRRNGCLVEMPDNFKFVKSICF